MDADKKEDDPDKPEMMNPQDMEEMKESEKQA